MLCRGKGTHLVIGPPWWTSRAGASPCVATPTPVGVSAWSTAAGVSSRAEEGHGSPQGTSPARHAGPALTSCNTTVMYHDNFNLPAQLMLSEVRIKTMHEVVTKACFHYILV